MNGASTIVIVLYPVYKTDEVCTGNPIVYRHNRGRKQGERKSYIIIIGGTFTPGKIKSRRRNKMTAGLVRNIKVKLGTRETTRRR